MNLFYIIIMVIKYTRSQLEALPKRKLINIILEQQETIIHLENTVTQLQSTMSRMGNTILRLEERIRQLEGQLHKDSHNSHIPPGQSRYPIKNLREPTDKNTGGQPGHSGQTLARVENPTRILTHKVTHCQRCGQDLSHIPAMIYERRQVFDIPAIQLEVTEHQAEKKLCPCGQVNWAEFPPEVQAPIQYGINIQTLVSTLVNHGYLSQERVSEMTEYLIGHPISEATIGSIQEKLCDKLAGFEKMSKLYLSQSEVTHHDATGVRVEGKPEWAHVTATEDCTHYAIDPQKGKEALDRIGILPHFQGTAVHDDQRSYYLYDHFKHGSCNAHHSRELIFFYEEEKADWAGSFKEHLLAGKVAVEEAKQAQKDHLEPEFWQAYCRRYDEILSRAQKKLPPPVRTGKRGKLKKSPQQNFIERMLLYKEAVLRFMSDFQVPFTNNLAERDLGMFKVKGKVSGTFRSQRGAEYFARIRGYISTVRKHGANVFQEVRNALLGNPFLLQKWRIAIQFLMFLVSPASLRVVLFSQIC